MKARTRLLVLVTVIGLASYVAFVRMGPYPVPDHGNPPGVPPESRYAAYYRQFVGGRLLDIYAGFYPNMVYSGRAVRDWGHGILWNPLHNCGQPFYAMVHSALLYPPKVLTLLLDPQQALHVLPFIHLILAGLFAYLFCRELGAGAMASLSGAVVFELGNATMENIGAHPHVAGSFVWMPAAMLFCERTLRAPSVKNVAGLALVLAFDLLAGFPQTTVYIYQLIGLRLAWELASRP